MDLVCEALGATTSAPTLRAKLPRSRRHRRRAEVLRPGNTRRSVAFIAGVSAVSMVSTVAAPVLVGTPLLLVGLSPRIPFLALAARDVGLAPFLAVTVPRMLLTDPVYFRLGRRCGRGALAALTGRWRHLARMASLSAPLLVLLRPVGRNLAVAGASPSPAWLVGVADVASTVAYLVVLHSVGAAAG